MIYYFYLVGMDVLYLTNTMTLTQPNLHRKTTERTVEKGGSRNGSPLEGESGLTPARFMIMECLMVV